MMNKNEKKILPVIIIVAIIICVVIAILTKKNDNNQGDPNNIYNVKIEQKYSKSKDKFTLIFTNVKKNIYIIESGDDKEKMYGNNDEKIIIDNLEPGTNHLYIVNENIVGTSSTERKMNVELPYYNEFYSRSECEEYRDKLKICSSQFLNYKATEDMLKNSIKNYNTNYNN